MYVHEGKLSVAPYASRSAGGLWTRRFATGLPLLDQALTQAPAQQANQAGSRMEWDLLPKAKLATLAFSRTFCTSSSLLCEEVDLQRPATKMKNGGSSMCTSQKRSAYPVLCQAVGLSQKAKEDLGDGGWRAFTQTLREVGG